MLHDSVAARVPATHFAPTSGASGGEGGYRGGWGASGGRGGGGGGLGEAAISAKSESCAVHRSLARLVKLLDTTLQ